MARCYGFIGVYLDFLACEGAFWSLELLHATIQLLQYFSQSNMRAACVVQLLALLYPKKKENRS
jgi:hypothetical protein